MKSKTWQNLNIFGSSYFLNTTYFTTVWFLNITYFITACLLHLMLHGNGVLKELLWLHLLLPLVLLKVGLAGPRVQDRESGVRINLQLRLCCQ